MLRFEKVATPMTVVAVTVPFNVAPGVPVKAVIDSSMFVTSLRTVLPTPSCTATLTAGVITALAAVVVGCTMNTSTVGVLIRKLALVAPVRPLDDAPSV